MVFLAAHHVSARRASLRSARGPTPVYDDLGFGTFRVGLVAGSQFAASLISLLFAGRYPDSRGLKRAVITGLLVASMSGVLSVLFGSRSPVNP
jgi:MFS family permease